MLFNGFKPLFAALTPADVNKLVDRAHPGLPGRGRHPRGPARQHRVGDQHAGRARRAGRRPHRQPEHDAGDGRRPRPGAVRPDHPVPPLRRRAQATTARRSSGSLDSISDLAVQTADLVTGIRPGLAERHQAAAQGRRQHQRQPGRARPGAQGAADQADEGGPDRDLRLLVQLLPLRVHGHGHRRRTVRVPTARRSPRATPSRRGATSDEHSLPRAQPGHHRRDQPRRHRRAAWSSPSRPATCRSSVAATPTTPTSARPVGSSPTTRSASPASGSARSGASSSTATRSRSSSRSTSDAEVRHRDRRRRSRSRRSWARCSSPSCPAGRRAARGGQRRSRSSAPSSPYNVVEVFEGLAERSERIDTDQLADALDTMADADPQHPGGVPRRAAGRLRAVGQRRRAGRRAQHAAAEPAARSPASSVTARTTSSR